MQPEHFTVKEKKEIKRGLTKQENTKHGKYSIFTVC
jgi:hypothetical protein